ncbi:MAG: efflux RND transporter permease subunit, partial [Psychroflexus halocasei]
MQKLFSFGFWNTLASAILRNRILIIVLLAVATFLLALQWKNMRFSYSEANLLPDDAEINQQFETFTERFGSDGNLMMIGTDDEKLFTPKHFQSWKNLADTIATFSEVKSVSGIHNLQKLVKKENPKRFDFD